MNLADLLMMDLWVIIQVCGWLIWLDRPLRLVLPQEVGVHGANGKAPYVVWLVSLSSRDQLGYS